MMLFVLCPVLDTGQFSFKEIIFTQDQSDTFRGKVTIFPQKEIRMEVRYPEKQVFLYRNDSIYMMYPSDTQIIYMKGVGGVIFGGKESQEFSKKRFEEGCYIVPVDTFMHDTLILYGNEYIDSLYFVSEEMRVKFYLGRGK